MSEWRTSRLQDVLEFREGPGILAVDFREDGVPLIRLAGLKRGAHILDASNYLDPEMVEKKWKQFRLREGDVLLSTSASLGEVARVSEVAIGAIPYTGIISFRPLDDRIEPDFIAHMLRTPSFKAQLEALGVGSVMRHFGPSHLRAITVSYPDRATQRAIAEVLGALDDKIAANDRILALADDLIRAMFEKLEGPPIQFADIATNVRRQVAPESVDREVPYIGLEHIPRRRMWLSAAGAAANATSSKSSFEGGDVLFGKLRPYFHKVVRAPYAGICSTDVLVLRAKDPTLAGLVLAAAASDIAIRDTTAASEGTRMPRTKWADLGAVTLPWPGADQAKVFSRKVTEFGQLAAALAAESRQLAKTRDELLPLLMSGRVRVRLDEPSN